jgi:ribosomal protein L11 methyltransferase
MQIQNRRSLLTMNAPQSDLAALADAVEPYAESFGMGEIDEHRDIWVLQAVLPEGCDLPAIRAAFELVAAANNVPLPAIDVQPLQDTDWLSRVARDFPPLHVGRIFLHGSHIAPKPGQGAIRLRIDAGAAFGSGEHQTTQGCLLALQDLRKRWPRSSPLPGGEAAGHRPAGEGIKSISPLTPTLSPRERGQSRNSFRILDMGCGSGILALAAAKLWKGDIVAVDIDEEAVRVTRANARINGEAARIVAGAGNGYRAPILARARPFDLIVSNILARPLRRMAPALARALKPGGHAVLSGLLNWQAAAVLAAHRGQGLRLVARYPVGEWQTLVLAK